MIRHCFSSGLAVILVMGFGVGTNSAQPLVTIELNLNQEDVRILGGRSGDHSGHAVASGDINGDGYDDVLIGAYAASPSGGRSGGETYVIFGSGALPATVDFARGRSDVCILGDDEGDLSGYSVASGDVNGDGYDDVIIGAWAASPRGGKSGGETYVIFGSGTLPDTIDLAAGEEDVRVLGDDEYDDSGQAVASGDINGDGFDEIIIGAWAADPPGGGNAGETYIIYGSDGLPDTVDLAGGEEDVRILGDDDGDLSGFALASGDMNGDGYDDVIIGAPWADQRVGLSAGEAYIIFGSGLLPDTVDLDRGEEDVRILGEHWGDQSGHAVASGDINGDGYGDVVIGAWAANPPGGSGAGVTYVVYGSEGMPDTVDLAGGEGGMRIPGGDAGDVSGFALAKGDVNGDGCDDVIIGAPQARALAGKTYVMCGSGALPDTIDLAGGEEDVRILGDDEYDRSGRAVASGDVNSDGYDDVIIGANEADPPGGSNAGETYIIYGRSLLVTAFELLQTYPNPFHSTITIRYTLPHTIRITHPQRDPPEGARSYGEGADAFGEAQRKMSLHTTLKIYTIHGQAVRTLVDEVKETGHHEVTWDERDRFGNEVENGVYLYRLAVNNFTTTKRMVLMR
ncbi:MAG: FG-GAP repeat protein [Gemmatimonadota bacterium]|nr:MAG: FG-GAP repeat protein [Gemmatimonadota bacterium]